MIGGLIQIKQDDALAICAHSCDLKLELIPYEIDNNSCMEGSNDASKKILNERIHDVKIFWKISYLVAWRTKHCSSRIFKDDFRISELVVSKQETMLFGQQKHYFLGSKNLIAWKARNYGFKRFHNFDNFLCRSHKLDF